MEVFSIFVKLHEDCSFLVRKETKAANPTLFPTELLFFFPFQEYNKGINSVKKSPKFLIFSFCTILLKIIMLLSKKVSPYFERESF